MTTRDEGGRSIYLPLRVTLGLVLIAEALRASGQYDVAVRDLVIFLGALAPARVAALRGEGRIPGDPVTEGQKYAPAY